MRILHVFDHSIPVQSGYASRSRYIIHCQRQLGLETHHITSPRHPGEYLAEETVRGLHFYRTERYARTTRKLPLARHLDVVASIEKRIDEVADEISPDVVHAHSPVLVGLAAVRAGRRRGIPVVYEVRATWEDAAVDHGKHREGGLRYRLSRALETRVMRRASAITTICDGLRQEILSRGVAEDRVTVIPNSVDIESFAEDDGSARVTARELGLGDGPVIGYIGSFYRYEGLHVLLEAAPAILEKRPDVNFLLVGGGPEEDTLRQIAAESPVANAIHMTGRVPHSEVRDYYRLMDLCVYPRLSMRLTEMVTPLKPLEAMAMGKNVVATDIGGHREMIEHGVNGALFAPDDPAAAAEGILAALDKIESGVSLGNNAREYVIANRTWEKSVARYLPIYSALTGNAVLAEGAYGAPN